MQLTKIMQKGSMNQQDNWLFENGDEHQILNTVKLFNKNIKANKRALRIVRTSTLYKHKFTESFYFFSFIKLLINAISVLTTFLNHKYCLPSLDHLSFSHTPNSKGQSTQKLQINRWVSVLYEVFQLNSQWDEQQYKRKIVEMWVNLSLKAEGYSLQWCHKLLQTSKYFRNKKRQSLSFFILSALFQNKQLIETFKDRTTPHYMGLNLMMRSNSQNGDCVNKYKYKQILDEGLQVLFDEAFELVERGVVDLDRVRILENRIETINSILIVLDCRSALNSLVITHRLWNCVTKFWSQLKNLTSQFGVSSIDSLLSQFLTLCTAILSHQANASLFAPQSKTLVQISSELWLHCLEHQNIFVQTEGIPIIHLAVVNYLLSTIKFGRYIHGQNNSLSTLSDFNANQSYVRDCMVKRIAKGVMWLMNQAIKDQTKSRDFVDQLMITFSHANQNQFNFDIMSKLNSYIPLSIALCQVLKTLAPTFSNLTHRISQCLDFSFQDLDNDTGLCQKLLVNGLLFSILRNEGDWLEKMRKLPEVVACIIKMNSSSVQTVCALIAINPWVEEVITKPGQDHGLVDQLINTMILENNNKKKSYLELFFSTDILRRYYSMNFPFNGEQRRIVQLLKLKTNKELLSLQLRLLEQYKDGLNMENVLQFLHSVLQQKETICVSLRILIMKKALMLMKYYLNNRVIQNVDCFYFICQAAIQSLQLQTQMLQQNLENMLQICQLLTIKQNIVSKFMNEFKLSQGYLKTQLQSLYELPLRLLCQVEDPKLVSQLLTYIFMHMDWVAKCTDVQLIGELWDKCVLYLQHHSEMFSNVEASCQAAILLNYLTALPTSNSNFCNFVNSIRIEKVMTLILSQANRRNKLIQTDIAYFVRGKVYLIFLLLLYSQPQPIHTYLMSLHFSQLDENRNDSTKILQAFTMEIFCNSRNYMPDYDIPLLLSTLSQIIQNLLERPPISFEGQVINISNHPIHHKYLHLYLKVMLEATERLYIAGKQNFGLWKQSSNESLSQEEESDSVMDYEGHQIQSVIEIVKNLTRKAQKLGWNAVSKEQVIKRLVEVYIRLKSEKYEWLTLVSGKLISKQTVETIERMAESIEKSPMNFMSKRMYMRVRTMDK